MATTPPNVLKLLGDPNRAISQVSGSRGVPRDIGREDRLNREQELNRRYYNERSYKRNLIETQQKRVDDLLSSMGGPGGGAGGTFGGGTGAGTDGGAYTVPDASKVPGLPTMDRAAYSRDVQQNVAGARRGLINAFNRAAPRGRGSGNLAYDRSLERTRFSGLSSGLRTAYGTAQSAAGGQQALRYGGKLNRFGAQVASSTQRFGAQVTSNAQRAANVQQVGMERLRQQGGLRTQLLAGAFSAGRG